MLIEVRGQTVDADPEQLALEAAIVRCLKRHGATRQSHLFYKAGTRNYLGIRSQTDPKFLDAIEQLVVAGTVLRSVTRRNGFLLRLASKRRQKLATVQEPDTRTITDTAARVQEPGR